MNRILVTGASGFLGLNLLAALRRREADDLRSYDRSAPLAALASALAEADVLVHLESLYRSTDETQFEVVNGEITRFIAQTLDAVGRKTPVLYASSTQAEGESAYGRSKRSGEKYLEGYAERTGAPVTMFRLPNEFGKWCRPYDNSVVATFCHQLARGQEIAIHDPEHPLSLVYVDDIVAAFLGALDDSTPPSGARRVDVTPAYTLSVGQLAQRLRAFQESRSTLILPDFSDRLTRCLYATYLSHLEGADFAYALNQRTDARGELAEFFKSPHFGQVFLSRTRPGVTRGNHYHDTKAEKFCVLEGEALIRFRHLVTGERIDHRVAGTEFRVVDIPPGYTHCIENVGLTDLIVLFWASEIFDPALPDTFSSEVLHA